MRKFIANRNIDRYRQLLADESDARRRAMLERLLAEEEEIWAGLETEYGGPEHPPSNPKKS